MFKEILRILCFLIVVSKSLADDSIHIFENDHNNDTTVENSKFPVEFLFGAATAAFQIEGGWNEDGKGPNIWDTLTHDHPDLIFDKSNADIGPDSYHFYEEDIKALKETGFNFYRFSISWSRVLPDGDISSINEPGIRYYNTLIDKLLENGIEPMITMYHYDLPDALQKFGGLLNPKFIDYFEQYSELLFSRFGDRVKWWITFNEPIEFCINGYGDGTDAPLVFAPGIGEYYCIDNILKAHATTFHLYKNNFYRKYSGKIGITLNAHYAYAVNNDTELVDRGMQYELGWLTHPLFSKSGGYPPIMVENIASNSVREGRAWSRLPTMSKTWKSYIRGSADFLGLNYYTSRLIDMPNEDVGHNPSWQKDLNLNVTINPDWARATSDWLYSVPEGLGDLLRWIKDEYGNPEIIITENGWSDGGEMNDTGRISYLADHFRHLLAAINEDGCNVSGYTVWSLIDNFEWLRGYSERFGLYSVDFTSDGKERSAKRSANFMKDVINTRIIPDLKNYLN